MLTSFFYAFFKPSRRKLFKTLEKLTKPDDFMINCDCFSRNFFTRSSSSGLVPSTIGTLADTEFLSKSGGLFSW